MKGNNSEFVWVFILATVSAATAATLTNFQVVHFLDPTDSDTIYYGSWNSDQWVKWLRNKYEKEAAARQTAEGSADTSSESEASNPLPQLRGSWVHIVIPATQEDFNTAYHPDSVHAYTDPQRSDYFWSDYAFPVYVIIRSPNATVNVTEEEAATEEEQETRRRVLYGYNVYNCAEKQMFVNSKINAETLEPLHYQTFFPKKVKNPKDKLRIPLSVCKKISQTRSILDEIRFQLGPTNSIL